MRYFCATVSRFAAMRRGVRGLSEPAVDMLDQQRVESGVGGVAINSRV